MRTWVWLTGSGRIHAVQDDATPERPYLPSPGDNLDYQRVLGRTTLCGRNLPADPIDTTVSDDSVAHRCRRCVQSATADPATRTRRPKDSVTIVVPGWLAARLTSIHDEMADRPITDQADLQTRGAVRLIRDLLEGVDPENLEEG